MRSVILFFLVCNSPMAISQDSQRELSKDFEAAAPFVRAASDGLQIKTVLDDTGQIVVVAELQNIHGRTSGSTGLPDRRYVGTWSVRFVVVPKLSKSEMLELLKFVDEIPSDKAHLTKRGSLSENLADVVTETHAYRIVTSKLVPTEKVDHKTIKSFVRQLSKTLRSVDGMDVEKNLELLFLF